MSSKLNVLHVLCAQLLFPDLVEGLVLLNIDPNGKGWIDWAATKVPARDFMYATRSQGFCKLLQQHQPLVFPPSCQV